MRADGEMAGSRDASKRVVLKEEKRRRRAYRRSLVRADTRVHACVISGFLSLSLFLPPLRVLSPSRGFYCLPTHSMSIEDNTVITLLLS